MRTAGSLRALGTKSLRRHWTPFVGSSSRALTPTTSPEGSRTRGKSSGCSTVTSKPPRRGSLRRTSPERTSSARSSTTSPTASEPWPSRSRPTCRRPRHGSSDRCASRSTSGWRRLPTGRPARRTGSSRLSRSSRAWTCQRPLREQRRGGRRGLLGETWFPPGDGAGGGGDGVTDTHAHLDACADPAEDLVARARAAGVDRIVAVGSGLDSCRETLAIARGEPGVWAALGIHPHQAGDPDAELLDDLRELLADERAVAVGETGLDFYRDYAPRDRQRDLFRRQLELAAELGKAVVVHTRDADDETASALDAFDGTVVLHCFSSPPLLPAALERGYYVSFAGNVTYPKAEELREAARRVPADRLLAETDSPYLSPQPRRGRPNEPANVVHTVAVLAETRGDDPENLAARLDANAVAAF